MDCSECCCKKIDSLETIYTILDKLPQQIGMTKIMPPICFEYSGLRPEDSGISGIVLIAESHISIHTFPKKRFAYVDVFSCKEFNTEETADIISSSLGARHIEKSVMNRGRHFPKEATAIEQIAEMNRVGLNVRHQKELEQVQEAHQAPGRL